MSINYYAYAHCKPDGTPFYIGKGRGKRIRDFSLRNVWHKRIVAKHGAKNILVGKIECSTEAAAFELEKGLIKCLRRSGVVLCNLTDGGEGASGVVVSDSTRRLISDIGKKRFADPEKKLAHKVAVNAPHVKKKMLVAARIRFAKPETLLQMSETAKALHTDPVYKARHLAAAQSPERNQKISEALRGHSVSAYARQKIAEAHVGKKASEDTKKKMSEARKGHPTSEATKAKIGAAAKARHAKKIASLH